MANRQCEFLHGCAFTLFINDEEAWNKIKIMFCEGDYLKCRRYKRRSKGFVVPLELWPMDNECLSESVYQIKFSLKKFVEQNMEIFSEFKETAEFSKFLKSVMDIINSLDLSEGQRRFFLKFFGEFYEELFIKNFNEDFFIKMVHFYEKGEVGASVFDPGFLIYTTNLFESFYKWLTKSSFTEEDKLELLSVIVKFVNFANSFFKKNVTMLHDLNVCYETFLKLKQQEKEIYSDSLTGVYNRKYLDLLVGRFGKDFNFLIFIDLDDFKDINDNFGHDTGDIVLKEVGNILRTSIRANDVAVRYGGDEFVVAVDVPDKGVAIEIAERIERLIKNMNIKTESGKPKISASIGVSGVSCTIPLTDNLKKADKALYKAKDMGKGKVYFIY